MGVVFFQSLGFFLYGLTPIIQTGGLLAILLYTCPKGLWITKDTVMLCHMQAGKLRDHFYATNIAESVTYVM